MGHLGGIPADHDYFSQAMDLNGAIYVFGGSKEGAVSMFEYLGQGAGRRCRKQGCNQEAAVVAVVVVV